MANKFEFINEAAEGISEVINFILLLSYLSFLCGVAHVKILRDVKHGKTKHEVTFTLRLT